MTSWVALVKTAGSVTSSPFMRINVKYNIITPLALALAVVNQITLRPWIYIWTRVLYIIVHACMVTV